jgi:hypothetical protein
MNPRSLLVTAALTAAVVGWAAVPLRAGFGIKLLLVLTAFAGVANLVQLGLAGWRAYEHAGDLTGGRLAARLIAAARLPWAEVMTVGALVLEALHHARPWHTAVLGLALLGYLFAMHLTETGQHRAALRPQLPLLAAGLGLLALATGATALPAASSGLASGLIRSIAIIAAVLAAGLALPTWSRRASQPASDRRPQDR